MGDEMNAPLTPREIAQILHAREYARNHLAAGAPGHGQFVLIAKLSHMLDEARAQLRGGQPIGSGQEARDV